MLDVSIKTDFYVATGWPPVEEHIRVLKYGQMFAVFDRYGNIRASGLGEHGIYFKGTRYLSRLMLSIGDVSPLFLSSGVRADNALFSADLIPEKIPDKASDGARNKNVEKGQFPTGSERATQQQKGQRRDREAELFEQHDNEDQADSVLK